LIAAREETGDGYSRFMPIRELDGAALCRAREIFESYKNRGVIISGEFDDTSWSLTNEARNVGLTLLTFEGGSKKPAMEWIGCAYRQYVTCVKAYIVFHLGEISLYTMRDLTLAFNRLALATADEATGMLKYAAHITALLQLIPGGGEKRDAVIEELEEKMERRSWGKQAGDQRRLADFRSYLRFNEVLADFWRGADERQKLFYFPLYFWWNLTAVLPLRPMEFLLTPRDCLRVHNGENILTVRRTKLKGGNEKIGYRIADDYELKEYVITERLADELRRYIEATDNTRRIKLDTLFKEEPYSSYLNHRRGRRMSRYYTYAALNLCLKHFYDEVITVRGEDISEIHLGDTRHLAMTNLILSGGSPVICRELAGHADIDISAHYYANISNLVECATLERYRKSKGAEAMIHGGSRYPLTAPPNTREVSGGRCASGAFYDGRVDDCLKVSGNNGHIGDCRQCQHYLPDNPGVVLGFYDAKKAREQVDADSAFLIRMIELVRKGLGHTEDIGTALLRLQNSGDHYGKCLWEKYTTEGKL